MEIHLLELLNPNAYFSDMELFESQRDQMKIK